MTHTSDDFPEGRVKLIHPYGSVAKVKFQITSPGRCAVSFPLPPQANNVACTGWGVPFMLVLVCGTWWSQGHEVCFHWNFHSTKDEKIST